MTEEKVDDPKKQMKLLKAALKLELKKNAKHQGEIVSLTENIKNLQDQLNEINTNQGNASLSSQRDKETILILQSQLKAAQAELEDNRKNVTAFEDAQKEHEQDLKDIKEKLEVLTIKNAELIQKNMELEETIESYKEKLEEAKKHNKGSEKTKGSGKLTKLQSELDKLKNECMSYKEKLEQSEKDKEDIYVNSERIKKDLYAQFMEVEKHLKEKENVIMKKEGEIATLKSSIAETKAMGYYSTQNNSSSQKGTEGNTKTSYEYEARIKELNKNLENNSNELQYVLKNNGRETIRKLWEVESDKKKAEEAARTSDIKLKEMYFLRVRDREKELGEYKSYKDKLGEKDNEIQRLNDSICKI